MRIVSIIHAAGLVLVLAVPATQAEAKGRRAFGGVWTAAHAAVPLRGTGDAVAAPVLAIATAAPAPSPIPGLRETKASEAKPSEAKPVIREAVAAAPWCANGRVVGSGAGFCEIN